MPDFSKCINSKCPLAKDCWRFNCPPSEFWQAYDDFKPEQTEDGVVCEFFKTKPKNNEQYK